MDSTAGSALVTAYVTGREFENILEFCPQETPARPGLLFFHTPDSSFTAIRRENNSTS